MSENYLADRLNNALNAIHEIEKALKRLEERVLKLEENNNGKN